MAATRHHTCILVPLLETYSEHPLYASTDSKNHIYQLNTSNKYNNKQITLRGTHTTPYLYTCATIGNVF